MIVHLYIFLYNLQRISLARLNYVTKIVFYYLRSNGPLHNPLNHILHVFFIALVILIAMILLICGIFSFPAHPAPQ